MIFKFIKICVVCILTLGFWYPSVAQTFISESQYDSLKTIGLINNQRNYKVQSSATTNFKSTGYRPKDASFNLAIPPSDDGSSDSIHLPFTFCFYGEAKSNVFINSNGNISFDNIFTSGTPYGFPFPNNKVIAPFWSDVDTRARGGVYYKLLPNALIVNWEDVGYFNQASNKGNTFQLIITDGTSELLPFGYTVGFFYQNMEWTAGDGSGGINGFGGAPALVGMNAGDNRKYVLAGSYNKSDTSFFPKVDTLNGIALLNGQHTFLNPCQTTNLVPGLMGRKISDTIGVCIGDTLLDTYRFLAPEMNQSTYVIVTSPSFPGFSLIETTTGQMATATFQVVGSLTNMGYHTLSFRVFDNGSPNMVLNYDITIQVDSLPQSLQISGDTFICSYDTTQLSVPAIYETYLWSNLSIDPAISISPGFYTITVSANNCEAVQDILVEGYLPEPIILGPQFICLPVTVSLIENQNFEAYLWSSGDTSAQIFVSQGGLYQLTVTDKGCVNTTDFFIEEDVYVQINTSNLNSCNGDSVTLSVLDEYDELVWSTGDTSNSIRVPSGVYWVRASLYSFGALYCEVTDTISIGNKVFPPVSVMGDALVCGDTPAHWTVIGNYDSYLWDDESTNNSVIYVVPGIHSVTITSATCVDSTTFQYQSLPDPIVEIRGHLFHCDAVDSSRLIAVGGPWDSIIWNTGDRSDTIYTGIGMKYVTVWKNGCSGEDSFPVNELINGVDVHGITDLCPGQATRLTVESGFDLYQWSTGAIGFSTIVNSPGDYWCVVHLDSCSATTDTVTVTLASPDSVKIMGDTLMCDSVGGYLQVDLDFRLYYWSTGENTPFILYTQPGMYSITVEDTNFCVTSDSIMVIQKPSPQVSITGNSHYCFEDSTLLSAGIFDSYLWANGATTATIKARSGVYSVVVVDSNGCEGSDRNFRVSSSAPQAHILYDSLVCEEDSMWVYTLVNSSESILWGTGDSTDSLFTQTGWVYLGVSDIFGCLAENEHFIPGYPLPKAGIRMNPPNQSQAYVPVFFGDDSELNNAVVESYYWNISDSIFGSFMDSSISFYIGTELNITHALTSDLGCTDTIKIVYLITDDIVPINVITPNGDGVNDYLVIPNIQKYPNNSVRIYNRWGVEVAFFKPYRNTWDAYFVNEGVYFYVIELDENTPPIKGHLTVIK